MPKARDSQKQKKNIETSSSLKPSFEEQLPIIQRELEKRKSKWTLSSIPFEDMCQMVILRIFKKYHQYDPDKGEFSHWVNKVISSTIKNILRDHYYKYNRPCLGCVKNKGDDLCSWTPSGKQCDECPAFAKWKKNKERQFNVKQSLPLENHIQEVENQIGDFLDIDNAKSVIDIKIKAKLKPLEYKLYTLLYINGHDEKKAGELMDYKVTDDKRGAGYQQIIKMKQSIIKAAKQIIDEEDLAE